MAGKKKKDKELEEKIEKIVEKKVKEYFDEKNFTKSASKPSSLKIFGELVGYGILLLMLFVIFPRLPFVTSGYPLWLPIAFWTATLGVVFKVFKHATSINAAARLFEIGDITTSLYSTYWLIQIFPLDFSNYGYGEMNYYFRLLLYIVLFAMIVGIIVNFLRIFVPEKKP